MIDEFDRTLHYALKQPLVDDRPDTTLMAQADVEDHLPQRDPFRFVDRVTLLDAEEHVIVARFDLARAAAIFGGHFPGRPLFPGVLQIEAIGQAGIILGTAEGADVTGFALTHVRAARFMRPVPPGGELEIIARTFDDGLFRTVVGQVLRDGEICSVAAVSGVDG
jgi:3-hydroxyacyl-[acyl-carrier-protein] dehydratase